MSSVCIECHETFNSSSALGKHKRGRCKVLKSKTCPVCYEIFNSCKELMGENGHIQSEHPEVYIKYTSKFKKGNDIEVQMHNLNVILKNYKKEENAKALAIPLPKSDIDDKYVMIYKYPLEYLPWTKFEYEDFFNPPEENLYFQNVNEATLSEAAKLMIQTSIDRSQLEILRALTDFEKKSVSIFLRKEFSVHETFPMVGIYISSNAFRPYFHLTKKCGNAMNLKRFPYIPKGCQVCTVCFNNLIMDTDGANNYIQEQNEFLTKKHGFERACILAKRGIDPTIESLNLKRNVTRLFFTNDVHTDLWNSYLFLDRAARATISVTHSREYDQWYEKTENRINYKKQHRLTMREHYYNYYKMYALKNKARINYLAQKRYENPTYRKYYLQKKRNQVQRKLNHYKMKWRQSHQKHKVHRNNYSRYYCPMWRKTEAGQNWLKQNYNSIKNHIQVIKTDARKKNLNENMISDEKMEELVVQDCFFCGKHAINEKDNYFRGNGIDRMNCNLGYIDGNCIPCCIECNMSKRDYTMRDYLQTIINIAANYDEDDELKRLAERKWIVTPWKGASYAKHKEGAKSRNIKTTFTKTVYEELKKNSCFYCASEDFEYISLDRLDSSKDYTVENVVACCTTCNMIKRTMDPTLFIRKCIHVSKRKKEYFKSLDFNTQNQDYENTKFLKKIPNFSCSLQFNEEGRPIHKEISNFQAGKLSNDIYFDKKSNSKYYHSNDTCHLLKNKESIEKSTFHDIRNLRLPCTFCRNTKQLESENRKFELEIVKVNFTRRMFNYGRRKMKQDAMNLL